MDLNKVTVARKPGSLRMKFSVLYFLSCGVMACYYPFMAIYYQSRNLDYSQIGKLFAINSLVAVIAQPLWGILTDKYLNKKKTLLIVISASTITILGFIKADSYTAIVTCVIIFMIFQSPMLSINDAYCYEAIDVDKSLQYGKLRLMGSVGYAIVALLLAYAIEFTSIATSFYVYALLGVICILVLLTVNVKSKSAKSSINFKDIANILKNSRYLILCMSAMLTSACMNANGSYLAILIQKTGGNISKIGLLWFVVAMAELPVFFFGARIIKRFGPLNIFFIGLVFYSTRFLLDSICGSYQLVIAIQLMQAITYPLYTISTLQYINNIVPVKARTTAITFFAAFTGGIGGFIGNICGAAVINRLSVFLMFRMMSFIVILALGIGMLLKLGNNRSENV